MPATRIPVCRSSSGFSSTRTLHLKAHLQELISGLLALSSAKSHPPDLLK